VGSGAATIVGQAYVADEFAYRARLPAQATACSRGGKSIGDRRVEVNGRSLQWR
jgi:hypothetical protein